MSATAADEPACAPKGFDSEEDRAAHVQRAADNLASLQVTASAASARGDGFAAAVVGATGATGRQLVRQLIDSPAFRRVTTVGRRRVTASMVGLDEAAFAAVETSGKLVQHEIDWARHRAAAATGLGDAGVAWGARFIYFHIYISHARARVHTDLHPG